MHPPNLPFGFSFWHDSGDLLEKRSGHPLNGSGDLRYEKGKPGRYERSFPWKSTALQVLGRLDGFFAPCPARVRECGNTPYGPAPPVSWSDNLAMAAYLHSEDMVLNNFFSHTGSDGSSAGQRISRQGYPWRTYGENIAVGYPTVSSVIQGWLGSEGHCRNLMNPAFTEIGAGYAIGQFGGNPAACYWTFDLADR